MYCIRTDFAAGEDWGKLIIAAMRKCKAEGGDWYNTGHDQAEFELIQKFREHRAAEAEKAAAAEAEAANNE